MFTINFEVANPLFFAGSLLLIVIFLLIVLKYVYNGLFHLRNVPGPWLGAYSRMWLLWAIRSQRCPEIFAEVNARYGYNPSPSF